MSLKPIIFVLLSILLFSSNKTISDGQRYYSLEKLVVKKGSIYVSYNISTGFGGHLEMSDSLNQKEANKIIDFLKKHLEIEQIEIGTHLGMAQHPAESKRNTQGNSEKIKDYMIKGGIDKNRLIAKGYEFDAPLIDTDEEYLPKNNFEAYTKNKRFEFKILNIKL